MKPTKDLFSKQSSTYKKYRPTYPESLYQLLLSHTDGRSSCWDVGTGNGQVAVVLSSYFQEVMATDLSASQLANAMREPNITYQEGRAEQSGFQDQKFDLVTVGQAVHWFDHAAFNREVKRVLKPGGTIAIWCYELSKVSPEIDEIIWHFYTSVVGPYWAEERRFIEEHYTTIPFDFQEVSIPDVLSMKVHWDRSAMEGYLNSWSAVQKFIEAKGSNPVEHLSTELEVYWDAPREVTFPIYMRIGKNGF